MLALMYQSEPSLLALDPAYPKPPPVAGEVLIRVHLAGICSTDLEITKGYMRFSGVLGHEFVGTVVEGPGELSGRRVVAEINCVSGDAKAPAHDRARDAGWRKHAWPRTVLGILGRDGTFAEYVAVPAENCHIVPDAIPDEQAVFAEPLAAAAQVVRDHTILPGTRVGVLGSGRLGNLCAQVLALRPCKLDLIGRNSRTLTIGRDLGLNTIPVDSIKPAHQYDLLVECTGAADGLKLAMQLVRPRGTIVLKSTYAAPPNVDLSPIVINELTVAGNRCGPLDEAVQLMSEGRIRTNPLIDAVFPLARGLEAFHAASQPGALKVLLSTRA